MEYTIVPPPYDGEVNRANTSFEDLLESFEGRSLLPPDKIEVVIELARRELRSRAMYAAVVPRSMRDTALDMMLELFVSRYEGRTVYVSQLIAFSGESPAAALRRVENLEEARLVRRTPNADDRRRVIVSLTEKGRRILSAMLRNIYVPPPADVPAG